MASEELAGQLGVQLTIERCAPCQLFWFDRFENLKLTPASTLHLFRTIGEGAASARSPRAEVSRCPRCTLRLVPTHDRQRNTAFQYLRCPQGHGRLTTYFDFLREKNFITPLSADELEELRRHVASVNCSNCGAPINVARTSSCGHCGSALSMIDLKQAGDLIALLRNADRPARLDATEAGAGTGRRTVADVDAMLPLKLERSRREVAAAFATFEGDARWYDDVSTLGLVSAGLGRLMAMMR